MGLQSWEALDFECALGVSCFYEHVSWCVWNAIVMTTNLEELEIVQIDSKVEHVLFTTAVWSAHQVLCIKMWNKESWTNDVTCQIEMVQIK